MYEYNIHPDNSPELFIMISNLIERSLPDFEKKKLLVDVDGTTIQTFSKNGKDIDIYDDYDVGAVFVKSEVDIGYILEDLVNESLRPAV